MFVYMPVTHVYDNGEEIPYCRRLHEDGIINRTEILCENDGLLYSFKSLIAMNIQPSQVLDWSSSIEIADLYAHLFHNQSLTDDDNRYICRCTRPGTFGKSCEYQLTHEAHRSFGAAMLLELSLNRSELVIHGILNDMERFSAMRH